jgi:hypothetical protein
VFGGLETNVFALMPVYAERIGIAERGVGLLVAIGALGAIALQIPWASWRTAQVATARCPASRSAR